MQNNFVFFPPSPSDSSLLPTPYRSLSCHPLPTLSLFARSLTPLSLQDIATRRTIIDKVDVEAKNLLDTVTAKMVEWEVCIQTCISMHASKDIDAYMYLLLHSKVVEWNGRYRKDESLYIHIYMYMYIYVCIYIYMYIYTYICKYTYAYIYTDVHAYTGTSTSTYTYTYTYTHIRIRMHI